MSRRSILIITVLAAFAASLMGCVESEEYRSVVFVSGIADNAPVFSDVYNNGDPADPSDDFIREDWIGVTFYNRPYHPIVSTAEGAPYHEFVVTRYRIEFERTDGGSPTIAPLDGAMSTVVQSEEYASATILLVPASYKVSPPLDGLLVSGEISTIAHVTFTGHEIGSSREQTFSASVNVNFANFVDEDGGN
jgi:hypothetical protein